MLPTDTLVSGPSGKAKQPLQMLFSQEAAVAARVEVKDSRRETTIRQQAKQRLDAVAVDRCSVGGQTHHFELVIIGSESQVRCYGAINQSQRMRIMNFLQDSNPAAIRDSQTGGGPLSDSVHYQECSLCEARRIERARGM